MKINKTLAAGLAATLAVSSLASVASAVKSRTWDMEKTYGKVTYGVKAYPGDDIQRIFDLGKDYLYKADEEGTDQAETFAIVDADGNPDTTDHHNGTVAYDYFMPFVADADHADLLDVIGGVTLVITGKQLASDGATTEKLVQKASLKKIGGNLWILPIYVESAPRIDNNYAFMPERFVQVDSVSIEVAVAEDTDKTFIGLSEDAYKAIMNASNSYDNTTLCVNTYVDEDGNKEDVLEPIRVVEDGDGKIEYQVPYWWFNKYWGNAPKTALVTVLPTGDLYAVADYFRSDSKDPISASGVIATSVEQYVAPQFDDFDEEESGETDTTAAYAADDTTAPTAYNDPNNIIRATDAKGNGIGETVTIQKAAFKVNLDVDAKGQKLIKKLVELLNYDWRATTFLYQFKSSSTYDEPAWMPRTANDDETIVRNEVWKLSDTNDYISDSQITMEEVDSAGQTYTVEDYNKGTRPHGFAGMASQFADFFNSPGNARKEAKVIFTFEAFTPAGESNTWKNGGIPSTEVGLRNFLEDQDVKDFALFVNYQATTGSLFATATLDPESGSVIFDVSNILAALGGTTIGSVQDIYYALASGISYDEGVGLWVKEVTYEYNDAASDAAGTTDGEKKDEEKPADNKPADNGEKEITIGGDNKETEIPADNNGGNASNNGSAVVDNGANKSDENPHTGVALAVIPAIVAGAAVVVSKKRK